MGQESGGDIVHATHNCAVLNYVDMLSFFASHLLFRFRQIQQPINVTTINMNTPEPTVPAISVIGNSFKAS